MHSNHELKLGHFPSSSSLTLATLPSMSLIPPAPFTRMNTNGPAVAAVYLLRFSPATAGRKRTTADLRANSLRAYPPQRGAILVVQIRVNSCPFVVNLLGF